MSYQFYKILHVTSIIALFTSLSAAAFVAADKRKVWAAVHGVSSLLVLVAGFGLLAKGGFMQGGFPAWTYIKIGIWIALGAMPILLKRKSDLALPLLFVSILLAAIGSYTAVMKPGSSSAPAEVSAPAAE